MIPRLMLYFTLCVVLCNDGTNECTFLDTDMGG